MDTLTKLKMTFSEKLSDMHPYLDLSKGWGIYWIESNSNNNLNPFTTRFIAWYKEKAIYNMLNNALNPTMLGLKKYHNGRLNSNNIEKNYSVQKNF